MTMWANCHPRLVTDADEQVHVLGGRTVHAASAAELMRAIHAAHSLRSVAALRCPHHCGCERKEARVVLLLLDARAQLQRTKVGVALRR